MVTQPVQLLRFADHALGRPYHAALVGQSARVAPTEPHDHADYFEFMGVLEGSGQQLLSEGVQQLRAGDVVLMGPGDRHALQGTGTEGMWLVNIAFPAAAWHGFMELARLPEPWGGERGGLPPHWLLDGPQARRAEGIFREALDRFHRGPTMLDLVRFWTELAELLGAASTTGGNPLEGRRPAWLTRVCAAMRGEAELLGGVPRMLELAAVSPAHLSRSMRAHYGMTPTEFVRALRLERAAKLLCTSPAPVTTVAYRCGFSAHSYFSRCFAAAYGLPPREYRRQAWQAFVPR
jgi:AraC family cel operon transcriptional repressor